MALQGWPPIDSRATLCKVLQETLGFCPCAHNTALPFLRDFLRLVVARTDGVEDAERFRQTSAAVIDLLRQAGAPAMQSWFVYALDHADLIMHNFNRYNVLIMDRGRWVLDGLERFSEPPPAGDEEAEPDIQAEDGRDPGSS